MKLWSLLLLYPLAKNQARASRDSRLETVVIKVTSRGRKTSFKMLLHVIKNLAWKKFCGLATEVEKRQYSKRKKFAHSSLFKHFFKTEILEMNTILPSDDFECRLLQPSAACCNLLQPFAPV